MASRNSTKISEHLTRSHDVDRRLRHLARSQPRKNRPARAPAHPLRTCTDPFRRLRELQASTSQSPDSIAFDSLPWLTVATASDRRRVDELRVELDLGEAEAIVLAIERHADLLLVDERRGRRAATASGLMVTGLLGVVVQAKRTGAIDAAKPILDALIRTARFWIGPALYAEVLTQLDEL